MDSRRSLFGTGRPLSLPFSPPPLPLLSGPSSFHPLQTERKPCTPHRQLTEGPHSQLGNVTVKLVDVYHGCDSEFRYDRAGNPRRILTKPGRPVHNHGWDNEKWDYILYVNDVIGEEEGRKYVIIDLLGQGTFGQVVKCQNMYTKELVAVKVIKNQPAYYNQSMMEVTVLEMLNNKYDREDNHHIVRLRDTFVFRGHLCIVVELLSVNLYELVKQNQYRGFSLKLCRIILAQVLDALCIMKEARIVHCDLKPENILLRSLDKPSVKVIDYGSACHEHQTVYTYIQSRFYRSPEVLLGLPYSVAIDMWSLGCISVELFLGLPIFPGASNYDQVSRIVETLGLPPFHMMEVGKDSSIYFERIIPDDMSRPQFRLKTRERFSLEQNRPEPPSKRYFASTDLEEIIMNYPSRTNESREDDGRQRRIFLHFVRGLLTINPVERWSPLQAINHPFITGHSFEQWSLGRGGVPVAPSQPIAMKAQSGGIRRPRANTLATLSLQDVPGPLQKLAQAAQGAAAPPGGPTDYRDVPVPVDSSSPAQPPLSFAAAAAKPQLFELSGVSDVSGGPVNPQQKPSALSPKRPENYYTNRYVDNRRVSNPAIALVGASDKRVNANQELPSSLPAWYHPKTSNVRSPRRRDSVDSGNMPKSPLSGGDRQEGRANRQRRRSTAMASSPSMDSIDEASE